MDIVSKINGNTLSATEFNQMSIELETLITSSGQTVSDAILNQDTIAVSRYAANNFYIDSGAADAYVLTLAASMTNPVSATVGYFVGMTIRFRAGNANTGASTVNVNSAGVKNLKQADGTTDLAAGDIPTTQDSVFRYDGTSFVLETRSVVLFKAGPAINQTIAASTATKVVLGTEVYDTHGYFDPSTSRFTPLTAGYYKFDAACYVSLVTGASVRALLYVNGVQVGGGSFVVGPNSAQDATSVLSNLIYMNGSTDYAELYVIQYSTDGSETLTATATYFSAFLIS